MNMKKAAAIILLAAVLVCMTACGKTANAAEAKYIYGQIKSVSGNEVTLLLTDYDEEKDNTTSSDESIGGKRPSRPEGFPGNLPENFDPEQFKNSSRPEGFTKPDNMEDFDPEQFGSGSMPEGFMMPGGFDGNMPENFDTADMPEGFDPKQFGGGRGDKKRSNGAIDEEKTVTIPVGAKVTTALGVETDFEALKAGDIIKCSIEKNEDGEEIVTAVEIME